VSIIPHMVDYSLVTSDLHELGLRPMPWCFEPPTPCLTRRLGRLLSETSTQSWLPSVASLHSDCKERGGSSITSTPHSPVRSYSAELSDQKSIELSERPSFMVACFAINCFSRGTSFPESCLGTPVQNHR